MWPILQISQHIAGKIPVFIRMGTSMLHSSDKRKASLAAHKDGEGEICRGCKISFTMLTILDKIKSKHISLHFNCMTVYCTLDIVSSHLQRQIYVEKEEKDNQQNYEHLCFPVTTSGEMVLKKCNVYTYIFHTTIWGNYKIILKPEVLGVNCILKQLWRN